MSRPIDRAVDIIAFCVIGVACAVGLVWGWLFVLSTCSYLVDYFGLHGGLRWSLILLFMVLKAGLIVAVESNAKLLGIDGDLHAGAFLLQAAIGWILDLWPRTATGYAPDGYAWAGCNGRAVGLSIAWMLTPSMRASGR